MKKERNRHMNKKLGHDAIYDARELGTPRMLLLGLQHLFAMFGATVLVPILVSGYGLPLSIQTTLLFAGIGTLLFHVCTKMKVPAFLGSSFAFLGGFQAVANLDSGKFAAMTGEEKLPTRWAAWWWPACCIWCWPCCSSWWAPRRSCASSPPSSPGPSSSSSA